jgi:hypothetical protein
MGKLSTILFASILALIAIMSFSFFLSSKTVSESIEVGIMSSSCPAIKDSSGTDFDWDAVTSNEMFEVCLLELAKNLRSGERMADWLRHQGFYEVSFYSIGIPGKELVWGVWSLERSGSAMPFQPDWSIVRDWYMKRYTYTVAIEYLDGNPQDTSVGHRTK